MVALEAGNPFPHRLPRLSEYNEGVRMQNFGVVVSIDAVDVSVIKYLEDHEDTDRNIVDVEPDVLPLEHHDNWEDWEDHIGTILPGSEQSRGRWNALDDAWRKVEDDDENDDDDDKKNDDDN
jgi:hypothetical protein